jgi:archaellum component FlaC
MSQEVVDLQKAVAEQAEAVAEEHEQINAELDAMSARIEELEEQLVAENPDMELIAAATADIRKHTETIQGYVEGEEPEVPVVPVVDNTLPGGPPTATQLPA